ncbi:MAG TPA: carboxypeptidase-like regulatory domain-containing protein, partial [Polyangiaceae bacterium]|nr:carboxypeptidase-like regulatory domain-containing protein [Polyangiaceae bacterium]
THPDGDITVRGVMHDELGEPIAAARLWFTTETGALESPPKRGLSVAACASSTGRMEQRKESVETDQDGRFCVRLSRDQLAQQTAVQVVFAGSASYAGVTSQLALDDEREGLQLEVAQIERGANLDEPEWTMVAELHSLASDQVSESVVLPLELSLESSDAGGVESHSLQRVEMRLGTATRLTIPTKRLGRPGPAQLVFAFDGNASYRPMRDRINIERYTSVRLESRESPLRAVAGTRLAVSIQARSGLGLPPPGWVQLSGIDSNTSVVPLDTSGQAELVIATPRKPNKNTLTITYQPKAAGWQATGPLQLPLHVSPPSQWPLVAWSALALLVFAWFGWSRRRGEPAASPEAASANSPMPYAHLEIVSTARDPDAGWSGVVVDAHEGAVVSGATIELCRPGFAKEEVVLSIRSNAEGAFSIPAEVTDRQKTHRLTIRAPGFARLTLALPPPGQVKVYVVSMRRAVLDRLVSWTKRRGHPFDSKAEPTPDWVAEVAHSKGQHEVETWAKAVSNAAFGASPPSDSEQPELTPPPGTLGAWAGAKRSDE